MSGDPTSSNDKRQVEHSIQYTSTKYICISYMNLLVGSNVLINIKYYTIVAH